MEFEPGHTPGLAFYVKQVDLSGIHGRAVDLRTPEFLSGHFRVEALAETEVE